MAKTTINSDEHVIWKRHVATGLEFLLSQYASQMVIFTPQDPIHHAMADHVSSFEDLMVSLETMPLPEALLPRGSHLDTQEHLHLGSKTDTLTILTHGCVTLPASLPAMEGMERFLQSMAPGSPRTGQFAFITKYNPGEANQHWITLRRDPDYLISGSINGRHNIHFSGTKAYVGGGHLGQNHLLTTEDLVNNHQGDDLTVNWPMQAIYTFRESIDAIWLKGLTLYDIFLHHQSDLSGFLDRVEHYLHGERSFGVPDTAERVLSRTHTPHMVALQIGGVTHRSYGRKSGKKINIDLTQ